LFEADCTGTLGRLMDGTVERRTVVGMSAVTAFVGPTVPASGLGMS